MVWEGEAPAEPRVGFGGSLTLPYINYISISVCFGPERLLLELPNVMGRTHE